MNYKEGSMGSTLHIKESATMPEPCVRQILPNVADFKRFWKEAGPFKYALTSNDFPPILLEPEEWIFCNDIIELLKELMQFDQKKMSFVQSPFNPKNKNILRPDGLSPWKITSFPEQWNRLACDIFVPEGHLTCQVTDEAQEKNRFHGPEDSAKDSAKNSIEKQDVEKAFFRLLAKNLENLGYLLLKPLEKSHHAFITDYLLEWEEDERDAGLL